MANPWVAMAEYFEHLGLHERAGPANDPRISEMYRLVTGTAMSDSVPWCAAFVGACLELSGYANTNSLLASSYKTFGDKLSQPRPGCIVVLKPQAANTSGHVGFFDSLSGGRVRLLGGNQGDAVKVQGYAADDIVALRWPLKTSPLPDNTSLPTILTVAPSLAPGHLSVAPIQIGGGIAGPSAADDILIAMGDRGTQVEALQKQLSDLNYHLGAIDGKFGSLTRAALLAFQADNDLATTGAAGASDLAALSSAAARPLARERAAAGVEKLRETGSQTVATADWLQKIGIGTGLLGALGFTDKQTNVVGAGVEGVKKALNVVPTGGPLPEQLAGRALEAQRAVEVVLNKIPVAEVPANVRVELVQAIDAIVAKTTLSSPLGDAGAAAAKVLEAQREIATALAGKLSKAALDANESRILFDVTEALRAVLAKPLTVVPPPTGGTAATAPGVLGPLLDLIPALIGGNGSATWLLVALGGYLAYSNGGRISQLRLNDYRDAANQNR